MKSECLPFQQVPHTSKLFTDFLSWSSKVQPFYSRPAQFSSWIKDEASAVRYDKARRERVANVLERQNTDWGASPETLENIRRFRSGALAAVTGQQVGLFGGPLFSLFKALTAVKIAEEARKAGTECVPVFWLATQDHDVAEVNHIELPGQDAALETVSVATKAAEGAPVGRIFFGQEIAPVVESVAHLLGDCEAADWLRASYKDGESFGSAFAKLFARVFAKWGVVLVDASDPEMTAIAAPIFQSALERSVEIEKALLQRGAELEAAGYHQQVKVVPNSTLLFAVQDGARLPVHRAAGTSSDFLIGEKTISSADLLRRIASAPEDFSANVLLRPVVQDYLLPTVAYTGGAAEVAYFAQGRVVYELLAGRATPIIPRFSATLIEPRLQALLEKYDLPFRSLFSGSAAVREQLASHVLPDDLQKAFDRANESVQSFMTTVREAVVRIDKTLADSANNAEEKMRYQLEQLRARAARAELRQTEVLGRHAELLSNALYPHKTLQEREIGAIYFLGRHGDQLLHDIYAFLQTDCQDHQLISL
ncbi:MAG TPA: bacillithiol biosynthesis cysteine-adding enzyme BshC [Terriglobales bacterium]